MKSSAPAPPELTVLRMRINSLRLCLIFLGLLAACSDAPSPTTVLLGGFRIELDPTSAQVTIRGAGARPLLAGLTSRSVSEGGPPITGFAVRKFQPAYQMNFGAFKPTGQALGPWRAAKTLTVSSAADGAQKVVLQDVHKNDLATLTFLAPERGHLRVSLGGAARATDQFSWGFACAADDHFLGFGAQTWDVDHHGFNVPIWVEEEGVGKVKHDDYDASWLLNVGRRHSSYFPVPQYFSRRGYVFVAETDERSEFDLCSHDPEAARVQVELPATLHVFDGPSPAEALARSSFTFGRPRLPPDFAFAPWNDAIGGSAEVRRVAQKLRAEAIPTSVIWTEDYADFQWDLNTQLYPDFPALASDLHGNGYKFLLYFQPFVYQSKRAWSQTAPQGYLIKTADGAPYLFSNAVYVDQAFEPQSLVDLTNPAARRWVIGKMRAVIAMGGDGWMGDFAEWLPTDAYTQTGTGLEQHNRYPVEWQTVQREALDGVDDGVDRLFFARSGYLGTPPLADVVWGGDQSVTFNEDDGMPTVLPIGIGLGAVGISTFGSDIAGYLGVSRGSSKELWLRWCALGAWSPVMRTHHGYTPPQNWNWEKDDESIAHLRRYASLHMALFPYWKGLAKQAHESGLSIWRGLALAFPEDERVWAIKDQVMVGDGLLVAPIVTEGAVKREVYLPQGNWFTWDGADGPLAGGHTVEAAVPVTDIAVYGRAGALVPMFPPGVMTLSDVRSDVPGPALVGDDRVLRLFLGASGSFEEAGGLAYRLERRPGQPGAAKPAWNGHTLGKCAATPIAPCERVAGLHAMTIWATGPGVLTLTAADGAAYRFEAKGGSSHRKLQLQVRH